MSRTAARFTQADVARASREGHTFIYFMRAGEFVKIGQSTRWKSRMATMQTGSPYTIVPLLVLIDEPALERKLHNRFRDSHFRGEWFHMSPAIGAYIKGSLIRCVAKAEGDDPRIVSKWADVETGIVL